MKKIVWMLSLALLSQALLQAISGQVPDKDQAALKMQRAWLKSKGLLKPFYFKDGQDKILEVCNIYKIKRLSPVLYNQVIREWENSNSIVLDDMPKDAVLYLLAYINSYGSVNQSNIEKAIIECPYVLDVLYFAHKYQLEDLESIILQNIASLASKHNLYNELDCENLEEIVNRLSLDFDRVRKALEVSRKYYPEIIKSSVKEIITHNAFVKNIVFSNDNKYLASCSFDKTVKLYDLENKWLIDTVITHGCSVKNIVFSNDNKYLVSCSHDGAVKFYDLENKQLIGTVITHYDQINNIAFSSNNKYLASCSNDGKVKIAGDTSHMSNKEIFDIVEKTEKSNCKSEKTIKNNYCNIQ